LKYIKILFLLSFITFGYADKVEITSDVMNAMNTKKEVHFVGNVKIKQLKNALYSDKVIVYFDENNQTKKYEAVGSVSFKFKNDNSDYTGSADKVVYLPKNSEYLLIGKAVIDDRINKRKVNGEKIIFNAVTGNAKVKGNKKKPVKFIFDLEKSK
jgi:lipopolysaccharide export system protein LptA